MLEPSGPTTGEGRGKRERAVRAVRSHNWRGGEEGSGKGLLEPSGPTTGGGGGGGKRKDGKGC